MPPLNTPYSEIELSKAGETVASPQAGDFILLEGKSFISKLIKFGQSLRNRKYAKYTHVAMILSSDGDLVEALSGGVVQSHISKYKDIPYYIVRIQASMDDRYEATTFARACIGDNYDWLDIASITFCLLTGLKISMGFNATQICSGLVSKALERTSAIFPLDNKSMLPAHLAEFYNVPTAPLQGLS